MAHTSPGKAYREGLTLMDLFAMFPDETAATKWFEAQLWSGGRCCGKCGSTRTREANHKTMPYWCTDCRSYFSVRTGTPAGSVERPVAEVGTGDLPLPDEPEVRLQHEAPSGYRRHAVDRMVHASPHPGSLDAPARQGW